MTKEIIEKFLERAEGFIRDATYDLENKRFDLAMVHVEQAIQLILKAKLLDLIGFFPKTHSLVTLIDRILEIEKVEELKKIKEDNYYLLRRIEDAYFLGRYYLVEFDEKEVKESINLYFRIRGILWKKK